MAEGGLDKHRIRMSDRRPVCIYPDKVKDFGVEERREGVNTGGWRVA